MRIHNYRIIWSKITKKTMQEFILKYKNFLEQNLKSRDFETKIEAEISLKNFEKFLEAQQELEEKVYN